MTSAQHDIQVPLVDLAAQHQKLAPEIETAIARVVSSSRFIGGPEVQRFETDFAAYCECRYAVGVASGTAAIELTLRALDIGPGDEIITTPFTFFATAEAIIQTGATVVFADIDPITYNLDPMAVQRAVTPRTRALLPVHLYGRPADLDGLRAVADNHQLVVIEDAAQAHGATNQGRPAGSFGTGAFSLYATKNMTTAEGGMVTTDNPEIAERVKLLRAHGMKVRYYHDMLGFNFRMTDIHAALGLAQLRKLPMFNERRRQNAEFLNQHLKRVVTPQTPEGYGHVWHQYTIRLTDGDRDAAVKKLTEAGVGSGIFYPVPVYRQKVYTDLGYNQSLPVTEAVTKQVISLPVHPKLSSADLETIIAAVEAF